MGFINIQQLRIEEQTKLLSEDLQADILNYLRGDLTLCTPQQIDNEFNRLSRAIFTEGYLYNEAEDLFDALYKARARHINRGGEA